MTKHNLLLLILLISISSFSQITADVLLVGGGGGGQASVNGSGSGGGGGQVRILTGVSLGSGVFPVVVGAGGSKGTTGSQVVGSTIAPNTKPYITPVSGSPGGNSTFNSYSAIGGGGALLNQNPSEGALDADLGGNSYGATTSTTYTGGLRNYFNQGGWHYASGGGAGAGGNGTNAEVRPVSYV